MIAGAPLKDGRPIATNHAAAARAAGLDLVAACDPDADRRALFAKHWNVRSVFASPEEMLASANLDLLVVATPPEMHEAVCASAVAHKVRGILCEKPLTGKTSGAKNIVKACAEAGVHLAANFMRRWDTSHDDLRRRISEGELGEIRTVFGSYTGTLRGNGSHLIDTVRMLVPGDGWSIASATGLGASDDDGAVTTLLRNEGCSAFLVPIAGATYFIFELVLTGTKGRARLLMNGNDIRVDHPEPSVQYPGYFYLGEKEALPKDTLPNAFTRAHEALAAAVRGERPLPVPAAEHIGTLSLIDSLVERARRPEVISS